MLHLRQSKEEIIWSQK